MRNELVTINETELEHVKESLGREYKTLLVLVVEKGETSDIYLVNKGDENKEPYLFKSLEKVVDYQYDATNNPTLITKIVATKSDGVYWLAFVVNEMITKHPDEVYTPRPWSFLTVSRCDWTSEAKFLEGFSYLDDQKMINIDGKNYSISYGSYKTLDEISPMYWRYILKKGCDGEERICQMNYYIDTKFGPFDRIEEWEAGMYPYVHESFHGYFGKDKNGYIWGMIIICDYFNREDEKYPVLFSEGSRVDYEYNIKFEKPLKQIKFVRRDFERTDSKSKYTATDVWKLEYVDGSKAIMFTTIGNKEYPNTDRFIHSTEKQRTYAPEESKFKAFILTEDYVKGIFSES